MNDSLYLFPPDDNPQKRCSHCKEFKPATKEYYAAAKTKDGLHNMCKQCHGKCAEIRAEQHQLPPEGTMKTCRKCQENKPATPEFFNSHRRYIDHLYYICKECVNAFRRVKGPELSTLSGHKRCSICKQEMPATREHFSANRSMSDGFSPQCKKCVKEKLKERRVEHVGRKSKICTICKQELPATHEHFYKDRSTFDGLSYKCAKCTNIHKAAYRDKNRDAINRRQREYKKAHREVSLIHMYRRRLRIKENQGVLRPKDIQDKYEQQSGCCYYCHDRLTAYQVDHVIPLSRGGPNDISNIVIACRVCNQRKGSKLLHEWKK